MLINKIGTYYNYRPLKRDAGNLEIEPWNANPATVETTITMIEVFEFWFAMDAKEVIALGKQARNKNLIQHNWKV